MKTGNIFIRLRTNKKVRLLFKPYKDWMLKRDHDRYLRTPDSCYLKTLKGIHEGKRCFVIGNGPSLRAEDLDKLKGEFTFAANTIYNIFDQTDWRPTYYLSVDDRTMKVVQGKLQNYDMGHLFLRHNKCTLQAPTNQLTRIYISPALFVVDPKPYDDTSIYFSEDVSDRFCNGGTVTYEAIQLAVYMGFKEIYLLGIDHHYSASVDANGRIIIDKTVKDHFDNTDCLKVGYPAIIRTAQYAYTIAKEYCDHHGIQIYNATRGGRLEVFERVDLDKIIGGGHAHKIIVLPLAPHSTLRPESEAA